MKYAQIIVTYRVSWRFGPLGRLMIFLYRHWLFAAAYIGMGDDTG